MTLETISPISPAAGYLGGKRNLARRICSIIQSVDHDGYAEPFVGMGGIFFRRAALPRFEAINDISGDVTTLFRVVRRHYQALVDELEWTLASREEFDRLRAIDSACLTDIERAARFLYLQRLAFGGKVVYRTYGVQTSGPARFNLVRLRATLSSIRDRLQPVVIERLPYGDFIRRYDR
ncbi:DNA adenine methylase [Sphingobium scionense]